MVEQLDVLAIGAHPDDVEVFVGGSLLRLRAQGYRVGVADLTVGEAGTHGTADDRRREASEAAAILGLSHREILDLPDSGLSDIDEQRRIVVRLLRRLRPRLVLCFYPGPSRHPDHGTSGQLVKAAAFLSCVGKIEPDLPPIKPPRLLHYRELNAEEPSVVIDISDHWQEKAAAIRAYASHREVWGLVDEESIERPQPMTMWDKVESRARFLGSTAGGRYGEGLWSEGSLKLADMEWFI